MGIIDRLKRLIMKNKVKSEDKLKETNEVSCDNEKENNVNEIVEECNSLEEVESDVEEIEENSEEEQKVDNREYEIVENNEINKEEDIDKKIEEEKSEAQAEEKSEHQVEEKTEIQLEEKAEIDVEEKINDELLKYRQNKSEEENKVAHFVLKNKEIEDIVKVKPTTLDEFKSISGIGKVKCEKYGQDIINIVKKYC